MVPPGFACVSRRQAFVGHMTLLYNGSLRSGFSTDDSGVDFNQVRLPPRSSRRLSENRRGSTFSVKVVPLFSCLDYITIGEKLKANPLEVAPFRP